MKKLILINSVIIISIALLFTGCFDKPFCPTPDTSKITASRGTIGVGGMVISGAAGAVEPGATVMVTDGEDTQLLLLLMRTEALS